MAAEKEPVPVILTIGHGTRSIENLVAILKAHGVSRVVDVRRLPRSAANPQYNYETLPISLGEHGIEYRHMPGLAGLRKRSKDSINTAWRNKSFQAFADYMQTPEFERSLEELLPLAKSRDTAIMCAESVPWRCHRSLIADALHARGVAVLHLLSEGKANPHVPPDFAKFSGTRVTYPAPSHPPQ